jgi:hypothetical protein
VSDHEARVAATALAGLTQCPGCGRWVKVQWMRKELARWRWGEEVTPETPFDYRSALTIQGHDRSPNTRQRCSASGQEVT